VEEWRPVVGYEGLYEVSSLGQVRSLDRTVVLGNTRKNVERKLKGKILKQHKDKKGTWYVNLNNYGLSRTSVHSLVARAFLGPTPEGKEICHGEGGRDNHAVSNLSFKTHEQNMKEDRERDNTLPRGSRHAHAKLTEEDVLFIREKGTEQRKELSELYDISETTIYDIVKRRSWAHI